MTRMADKVAVVVGAGQTEGETIGNGRAIAIRLAQEGATVLVNGASGVVVLHPTQEQIEAAVARGAKRE